MLLRTALLLLLCVSAAICATLGHYQARAEEEDEEAPAVTDAADFDAAPADVAVDDPPAAEKPASNSLFNLMNNLGAEADNPAADKPEVEEEPETKSEAPAVETFTGEDVTETQPSEEETVTQQKPAEEEIAQEKTSDESRQTPAQEEEEDNEIKAVQTDEALSSTPLAQEERSSWSFNSIRNSLQNMHGYFESMVELVGGEGGVCQYKCRYGETPQPRPGYQLPEPNGCSSSLVGFQLDMGIPAMKQCCDQLDVCYDTCGASKYDCDSKFRSCLHALCSDVNKSLGFVSKVEACESMADTLFNTVWTLGCRPYMNSQRAACVCAGEERDEL